jgi:Gnt-I system high-affinity gluconate transporter
VPLLVVLLGLAALVLLVAVLKLNAFLAFLVVSLAVGLALGLSPSAATSAVQKGLGDTLGPLAVIIGLGAMLGKLVADSGAAQRIATALVALAGPRRVTWALMAAGFVVGVPLFYTVGFVLMVPLVAALAQQYRLPIVYAALPMIAALSVTHGYLPPHPAPAALVQQFNADMGRTLLYGTLVGIPAIILAGPVFARAFRGWSPGAGGSIVAAPLRPEAELPGLGASLTASLLPVILLTLPSLAQLMTSNAPLRRAAGFLGDPMVAMLLALGVATWLLAARRRRPFGEVMESFESAIRDIAMILLIIAGAGAFKQVLTDGGASAWLGSRLATLNVSPLVLAWSVAALVRVAVGSATVAALTTAGLMAPLVAPGGVDANLLVVATGAGSLIASHVNDGGFWLFKEYFNLSIGETLRTWTVMETIIAVVGLAGVLVLDLLL